jgi:4-hydroxybenzoate polyprenyltransferase
LLAFSIFLFLSLAFVKRYAELEVQILQGNSHAHGRGYHVEDAPLIQTLGITSGYIAILVLALYLNSEAVMNLYTTPQLIWLAIPLMLYWVSWMWMKAHRGQMHDDPIVFAIQDKTSWVVGFLLMMTFIAAATWINY